MQSIQANNYPIHFNEKGYEALNLHLKENKYSNLFIIVDSNTNEFCLPKFLPFLETDLTIEIIEFEAGEQNKNIETCVQIWNVLTELGADRKSLVINLGGGVVTDLGGFVASTFKRGVDFIHIPTTLLSMVDASVGGKNGVDLGNLKNQIGVINVPKMVLIDTQYLNTLPQNEMRSGLAEMLKHGLIYDKEYWEQFLDLKAIDFVDFDELIYRSVEIKNEIVMQDPTEKNIRKSLNFGHTLGHAIESYFLENENKTTLLHGEAIAVGMILESYISLNKNLINQEEYFQIKSTIKTIYDDIVFEENDIEPILELLIHDKKNEYGNIQFALIEGIGKIKINQSVENELILKAFQDYKS
ncbi:3-dehydroquinate synthase [Flavobacterium gawalongense]|uniref:3-dehydroquinate synthase n=1 Tax=Flavobacterium gawalongense TaxID=2594432 RepID=A0A553BG61_9FLAO|nr:3-dehydroquinate synthase [Flavobacterium gawalongense]TRW99911.1 3-dehydroquinate synthase [Flavobacterium gawalongense]TRX04375.1 3-dehydroquinate synthase [Flavobacterium gawalongense]TRX07237.1 3-dehydroquinate synthase [Flavobacterium gawalongense]TRX07988.1 3-dehydroquinate synthase [Flavobacterium gawalongense]TRX24239.1 3-dehydroquinate synthase [Flavobacterium gawalongense]